jgi:hypothetical protein
MLNQRSVPAGRHMCRWAAALARPYTDGEIAAALRTAREDYARLLRSPLHAADSAERSLPVPGTAEAGVQLGGGRGREVFAGEPFS